MLIKRAYQTDLLQGARCRGSMNIIAFIEPPQNNVIRQILGHCSLWHDPSPRAPPVASGTSQPVPSASAFEPDCGITYKADPQFLEHACHEYLGQPQLPWEA